MESYHLRIHSQEQKYVDYIIRNTVNPVTVFHDADEDVNRSHLHSIFSLSVKLQTFRNNLLKEFPEIKGNSFYTLRKNDDTEANYRYVCKGKKNEMPIIITNLAEIDVRKYHEDYWLINKQLTKRSKKETTGTKCRQIADMFIKQWPKISEQSYKDVDPKILKYEVLRVTTEYFKIKESGLDSFIINRHVLGVYNMLRPEALFRDMALKIFTQDECEYLDRYWTSNLMD